MSWHDAKFDIYSYNNEDYYNYPVLALYITKESCVVKLLKSIYLVALLSKALYLILIVYDGDNLYIYLNTIKKSTDL